MNLRIDTILAVASVLLCVSTHAPAADGSAEKRYPLANHGQLLLKVPAKWADKLDQPAAASPPTISFEPLSGSPFIVTVTPLWRTQKAEPLPDRTSIRQRADLALQSIRPFAIEKDIKLVEFKGASGPGFHFFATDSAPRPGEYTFMTRGVLAVGELSVMFTILTNKGQDGEIQAALAMLKSAEHRQQ